MKTPLTTIVAVPARLKSSRLPNKVLADINGKVMLERVLEQCALAVKPICVVLCSDDQSLLNIANKLGFPSILTSSNCQSGSERIASVADKILEIACKINNNINPDLQNTLIINVQGDQPLIDPKIIDKIVNEFSNKEIALPIAFLSFLITS